MVDDPVEPPGLPSGGGLGGLGWAFVALLILGVLALLVMPGFFAASRASNERLASATLKTLATAQADFRANDRDGDLANNYWVYDVHSLYSLCPSTDGTTAPVPDPVDMIRLIEVATAMADATGRPPVKGNVPVSTAMGRWSLKSKYAYRAIADYEDGATTAAYGRPGDGNIKDYDSAGAYRKDRFGLMAVPVRAGRSNRFFILSESNDVWRADAGADYSPIYSEGTGLKASSVTWTRAEVGGRPFPPAAATPKDLKTSGWTKEY